MTLHPSISRDPFFMRFRSLARSMTDEEAYELAERAAIILESGGIEAHVLTNLEAAWLSRQEGKK